MCEFTCCHQNVYHHQNDLHHLACPVHIFHHHHLASGNVKWQVRLLSITFTDTFYSVTQLTLQLAIDNNKRIRKLTFPKSKCFVYVNLAWVCILYILVKSGKSIHKIILTFHIFNLAQYCTTLLHNASEMNEIYRSGFSLSS